MCILIVTIKVTHETRSCNLPFTRTTLMEIGHRAHYKCWISCKVLFANEKVTNLPFPEDFEENCEADRGDV